MKRHAFQPKDFEIGLRYLRRIAPMKTLVFSLIMTLGIWANAQPKAADPGSKNDPTNAEVGQVEKKSTAETMQEKKAAKATGGDTTSTGTSSGEDIECKNGGDARKLSIISKEGGCEVEYTKAGEKKVIGNSSNGTGYCGTLVSKVRGNLENSGFTCN
jgi:hypothetical protein